METETERQRPKLKGFWTIVWAEQYWGIWNRTAETRTETTEGELKGLQQLCKQSSVQDWTA
jgi:hypothetical protein